MRVAVDAQALKFTHVASSTDILHKLVYLEGTKAQHIIFEDTDFFGFLGRFTLLELDMLYRNTTGQPMPPQMNDFARKAEALKIIVEGMTPRQVVDSEIDAQIAIAEQYLDVPTKEARQFLYVKGARQPAVLETGLFPVTSVPLTSEQAAQAALAAPRAEPVRSPANHTPAAQRERTRPAAGLRVRQSNTRPTIWAVADRMWEEAGKPTDVKVVLELRKKMMTELETHEIKRTTSSSELGNWMKARLNN